MSESVNNSATMNNTPGIINNSSININENVNKTGIDNKTIMNDARNLIYFDNNHANTDILLNASTAINRKLNKDINTIKSSTNSVNIDGSMYMNTKNSPAFIPCLSTTPCSISNIISPTPNFVKTTSSDIINNNSNITTATKRPKKVACVECRQQKSKCDAFEKSPGPCSKCLKKKIACVLKRDYRRTYKRAKNEIIEKKFKELTECLDSGSPESSEIVKKVLLEKSKLLDNSVFTKDRVEKLKTIGEIALYEDLIPSIISNNNNNNDNSNNDGNNDNKSKNKRQARGINKAVKDEALNPIIAFPQDFSGDTLNTEFKDNIPITDNSDSINAVDIILGKKTLDCSAKTLGDVLLSPKTIAELYTEYVTKYHPFMPVIDVSKGPERLYSLSPCLFWVIMLIALRRKPLDFNANDKIEDTNHNTYNKLSALVKSMLAEITISPIIRYTPTESDKPLLNVSSVYSVQAFIIYTYWPPLTSSLSADTSWHTIGSACFQAIRVGLNSAQFTTEYANANLDLINEQIRTWICCNIVSQIIASTFGFPSFVIFDYSIINNCKLTNFTDKGGNNTNVSNVCVPISIRQMLHVQHFEYQLTQTMNCNKLNPTGLILNSSEKLPLLKVLSQQLDELEIRLKDTKIDDKRKFLLLVSRIHLLTYYFNGNEDADRESVFETKSGLVKLYNTSIELLMHANCMFEHDPLIIKYFPGVYVLNIWQTACIVCKLVHSSLSSLINVEQGIKAYSIAVDLTLNASVVKFDLAYRSSRIMKSIWAMYKNMFEQFNQDISPDKDFNLTLTIQSRMTVSAFFDCLYELKRQCGTAKLRREHKRILSNTVGNNGGTLRRGTVKSVKETTGGEGKEKEVSIKQENMAQSAREIISTVPLDPVPINAPISNPNSTLNTPSPTSTSVSINIPLTTNDSRKNSGTNISNNNLQRLKSNFDQILPHDNNNKISPSFPLSKSLFMMKQDGVPKNFVRKVSNKINNSNSPDGGGSHSSSNGSTSLDLFENWQSDIVWHDVDLLMNEFAFNPNV